MAGFGELALIERIRAGSTSRNLAVKVRIGDDGAVLRVPAGHEMVVTTDMLLEGRHFRREWHSPQSAGHRCLARGLSDLAGMGARPMAAFLSLALPKGFALAWMDGFLEGFNALAKSSKVELAGGDMAEAPGEGIAADVVLVGAVRTGRALLRSGAEAGSFLYVTGALGGSALELEQMKAGAAARERGSRPQAFPEPRVKAGFALTYRRMATACMDLSDGLSSDIRRLCEASGVGAEIQATAIPRARGATLTQALHGGEDYELLFTAKPWTRVPSTMGGVKITRIGKITAEKGVRLVARDGSVAELEPGGWEHFSG